MPSAKRLHRQLFLHFFLKIHNKTEENAIQARFHNDDSLLAVDAICSRNLWLRIFYLPKASICAKVSHLYEVKLNSRAKRLNKLSGKSIKKSQSKQCERLFRRVRAGMVPNLPQSHSFSQFASNHCWMNMSIYKSRCLSGGHNSESTHRKAYRLTNANQPRKTTGGKFHPFG